MCLDLNYLPSCSAYAGFLGSTHFLPSFSISLSASKGPHEPDIYECSFNLSIFFSITSTIFHAFSTSSHLVNKVWSPAMTSYSNLSYASGEFGPNLHSWQKSIVTLSIMTLFPGTFALNSRVIPSYGWTLIIITFFSTCDFEKSPNGTFLYTIAISVDLSFSLFPVLR